MEMKLVSGPKAGDVFASFGGELDLYAAPAVSRRLREIMEKGARRLVIDATALHYLDSSGVGVIIRLVQDSSKGGMALGFTGLGGTPRRVLQLCNVVTLLKVFPNAQAAWQGLEAS